MIKTLKNQDVYSLPEDASVSLVIEAGAEVWVEANDAAAKVDVRLMPGAHVRWMTYHGGKSEKNFVLEEGALLEYFHHVLGDSEENTIVTLQGNESRVLSQTIFFGVRIKNAQNFQISALGVSGFFGNHQTISWRVLFSNSL